MVFLKKKLKGGSSQGLEDAKTKVKSEQEQREQQRVRQFDKEKVKDVSKDIGKAVGVATAGTSITKAVGNKIKTDFSAEIGVRMIQLFKIFMIVAILMYIAVKTYSSYEGMLGIYIWLVISLIPTVVAGFHYTYGTKLSGQDISKGVKKSKFAAIVNFLPNFGCLLPLLIVIYVFIKIKPIINQENVILPDEFNWYNNLTFFLIVLLFFMTSNFYSTLGNSKKSKYADLWSGGVLMFSVLAVFTTIKLYVITLSFITDG